MISDEPKGLIADFGYVIHSLLSIYNGRCKVLTDYEQAKAYFMDLIMSTDGELRERAECVLSNCFTDWRSAATKTNNGKRASCRKRQFALFLISFKLIIH